MVAIIMSFQLFIIFASVELAAAGKQKRILSHLRGNVLALDQQEIVAESNASVAFELDVLIGAYPKLDALLNTKQKRLADEIKLMNKALKDQVNKMVKDGVEASKFPFHSTKFHGLAFADAALDHVSRQRVSTDPSDDHTIYNDMVVATFWGMCHGLGLDEAVRNQGGLKQRLLPLKHPWTYTGGTLRSGTKMGRGHERLSIIKCQRVLESMVNEVTTLFKKNNIIDVLYWARLAELRTVLRQPVNFVKGGLMLACSQPEPPDLETFQAIFKNLPEGLENYFKENKQFSDLVAELTQPQLTDATALKRRLQSFAGGQTFCKAGKAATSGWMTNFYPDAKNPIISEQGVMCQTLNLFAEYYVYGGVCPNMPSILQCQEEEMKDMDTQLRAWLDSQPKFLEPQVEALRDGLLKRGKLNNLAELKEFLQKFREFPCTLEYDMFIFPRF